MKPQRKLGFVLKRQQTLGEMTLEDFLVKAGVVQESSSLFESSLLYQNQIGNIASNGPLSASYRFRHVIGTGSSVSCNGLETQNIPQNLYLIPNKTPFKTDYIHRKPYTSHGQSKHSSGQSPMNASNILHPPSRYSDTPSSFWTSPPLWCN